MNSIAARLIAFRSTRETEIAGLDKVHRRPVQDDSGLGVGRQARIRNRGTRSKVRNTRYSGTRQHEASVQGNRYNFKNTKLNAYVQKRERYLLTSLSYPSQKPLQKSMVCILLSINSDLHLFGLTNTPLQVIFTANIMSLYAFSSMGASRRTRITFSFWQLCRPTQTIFGYYTSSSQD